MNNKKPTLFEWMGGRPVLEQLMETFYAKVRKDELLAPLFKHMTDDHPRHVAMWFEEVFGGEPVYTQNRGGFKTMIANHKGKSIQSEQRQRYVQLLLEAADEINLPDDPEFRSAFVAYVEWGSRRAQKNSQPEAEPSKRTTVPSWGWGEAPPDTL